MKPYYLCEVTFVAPIQEGLTSLIEQETGWKVNKRINRTGADFVGAMSVKLEYEVGQFKAKEETDRVARHIGYMGVSVMRRRVSMVVSEEGPIE